MARKRTRTLTTDRTFGMQNPIRDSAYGNIFDMSRNTLDMYKSQLYTLVFTNIGERLMMPEFGTRIQQLLFEPITENIYSQMDMEIKQAAKRWIPGINITGVKFDDPDDDMDNNRINLTIEYELAVDQSVSDQIQIEMSI